MTSATSCARGLRLTLGLVAMLCTGTLPAATPPAATPPATHTAPDALQRSADIYGMRVSARSGWQRGEEIYFIKCWYCHNQFAKLAPALDGLYKRAALVDGQPVSDASVAAKIRSGGPAMPAYRWSLDEADLADLLGYFKSGKCCYEGEEPPSNPRYRAVPATAPTHGMSPLVGGPSGLVRLADGRELEGIMVQLVSQKTSIRTTVYSDAKGRYEFPQLEAGTYTLRIARPLEFRPYGRGAVRIGGETRLDDIVLERVSSSELLPPTPDILAQLTPAEWLMNLTGTGDDKRQFIHSCNWCHSYQQIFRNRYDEAGWRLIVERMTSGFGSPLILALPEQSRRETPEEKERLIRWLATARGPESPDRPLHVFPGPRGAATQVIVTEYELPRALLAAHDVCGDSNGNIWYTSHRSPYIGMLDPRTGIVTEYRVPSTQGVHSGTHSIWIDGKDIVWLSEPWSAKLTRFDPRSREFRQVPVETSIPKNAPGLGNFALAPDGSVWYTMDGAVVKIDPVAGKIVERYPFKTMRGTYDNLISLDGRYWSGGQWPGNMIGLLDIRTGELWEIPTRTPRTMPSKGAFDREGNAWFGGRGGALIKLDTKTRQTREYESPTPYVSFYEAMADRNGEIWAGSHQGGRFARFDPRTERWIEYVLPEPFAHDRRTWIDNSTDPVTVWYVDHNGYLVRIQPRQ